MKSLENADIGQKYTLEQLGHNYMYTEKLGTNTWIKLKHFSLSRHKLYDKNKDVSFYRIVGDSCTCNKQRYRLSSDLQILLEVESIHSVQHDISRTSQKFYSTDKISKKWNHLYITGPIWHWGITHYSFINFIILHSVHNKKYMVNSLKI